MSLSSSTLEFISKTRPMLIGGEWLESKSGKYLDVINPATEEAIAKVSYASSDETELAIDAARASFDTKTWRSKTPAERARILWRVGDLLEEHCAEIAELETIDSGKPFLGAKNGEVPFAAECFRYYAGWCTKIHGETKDISVIPGAEFHVYTRREPVGVVGLIVPWNGPLVQAAWKLAPALAAGCSVVLKPSEHTPLSTLRLGELLLEAGMPPGVVNIVIGEGSDVGEQLAQHPKVDKISFTGSTQTGKKILQAASGNLKKVTLELGGKSPFIVLADADLEKAIPGAAAAIFDNAGQVCVAGSRLYIEEAIYDEVVSGVADIAKNMKLGPGMEATTEMGPLVSESHRQHVWNMIESGRAEGATVVAGGIKPERTGYYVEPTVFSGIKKDMRIVQEEIFGPVVCAMKFSTYDEIESLANDTIYGLAASIWTQDINKAHKLAAEIKAGFVWINCHAIPDMAVSFGGYKQSGWGLQNGYDGLLQYMEHKSVMAML